MRNRVFWKLKSVAFVGMDGSGKSTQVRILAQMLSEQNQPVLTIHPFGWKAFSSLSRSSLLRSMQASEGQPGHPASTLALLPNRLVAWIEILDIGLYVLLKFVQGYGLSLKMNRPVWLVSDRSFDDLLVKYLYRKIFSPSFLKFLRRLIPQAKITFWLQTDPAVALNRDQEFPEDYYRNLADCYGIACELFGWEVIPTTNRSPEAVFAAIADRLDLRETRAPLVQPLELNS